MKIAIDCRLYSQTGVGRYIRAILAKLKEQAEKETDKEYLLIVWKPDLKFFGNYPKNVKIMSVEVKWHSFKEQFVIPNILRKEKVNLVHFPYFNVPVFIGTKFIVTIHDLTINKFNTGKATNLPIVIYWLKKIFYFIVVRNAVFRSTKILTVSNTVKNDIVKTYGVSEEKVQTIYNGSDLEEDMASVGQKEHIFNFPYVLYVGNLHPHKNIDTLILAFDSLIKEDKFKDYKLVIVSPFDFFYKRLWNFILKLKLDKKIEFTGHINNSNLGNLYKNAQVFVFPSFSEGFGIPGVEAMSKGCPVVASDLPIFHEIYGDAALFFNPKNPIDLKDKITLSVMNTNLRSKMYISGLEQSKKYSWENFATQVLKTYEDCLNIRPSE
jgi:glycosyltransferase involved in cell wall biosynthesis